MGIDPGTTKSGWVIYDPAEHAVVDKGVTDNHELLAKLEDMDASGESASMKLAIEMIASMGMAVGADVFETCVWLGMFMHAWGYSDVMRLTRNQCKVHVCGSSKAKDGNVRQGLIDMFPATGGGKSPQIGTSKKPGPLFGMAEHTWPALAVALTAHSKLGPAHPAVRVRRRL